MAMKKIAATITELQHERLQMQAKRRGVSVSEVLRNAIDRWLYDNPMSYEAQSVMDKIEEIRNEKPTPSATE